MSDYGKPPPSYPDSQGPPPPAFGGPPPPDFGGPPLPAAGLMPTTTHTTFTVQNPELGETPRRMTCPGCRTEIVSRVETEFSTTQHFACIILLLVLPPCSCLPYCMDSLANVKHECPRCDAHLGTYKR